MMLWVISAFSVQMKSVEIDYWCERLRCILNVSKSDRLTAMTIYGGGIRQAKDVG